MGAVWAWICRPEIVIGISLVAILINLIGIAITATRENDGG